MRRERGSGGKRPFRDALVLYAVLAVLIVVIAALTGASAGRAAVTALIFFAVAGTYTWVRLAQRRRATARSRGTDDERSSGT